MITKKELLSSVLVKRLITKRFEGLGAALSYRDGHKNLPPLAKEGNVTGPNDNGGLFVRLGYVFEDSSHERIRPAHFEELSQKHIEDIVDTAMEGEKATLLGQRGYAHRIRLSNEFYPMVALQIVEALRIDNKLRVTLEPGTELNENHLVTSYLPPTAPGEEIKYSCRTEIATYLAICASFEAHYYNLAKPRLRFFSNRGFRKYLDGAKESICDSGGRILVPTAVVHAHNSRMIERSITGPIMYLGKKESFGEFAMITFEEAQPVVEEMRAFKKKREKIFQNEVIYEDNSGQYVCVMRFYPTTTPGRRSTKSNIILLSPKTDLGLKPEVVIDYVRDGYQKNNK